MNPQFNHQLFKNLHHRVLALFFILQIIQTDPKYQVHVPVIKRTQYLQVAAIFIISNQSKIILLFNTGIVLYKFQGMFKA